MNDFTAIALGAGLQDGLNPCIFMTCAVFIIYWRWLKTKSFKIGLVGFVFALVYALNILDFNFGPGQILVLQKNFLFVVKILYFILGLGAFVLGVLFFKDWVLIRRGFVGKNLNDKEIKPFAVNGAMVYFTTIALAVGLSALATFWPIDKYMLLLGCEEVLKKQWQTMVPFFGTYVVTSMWPLWFVWALLSIKNLRPSFLQIFCAAVFLTASSTMIFLFK